MRPHDEADEYVLMFANKIAKQVYELKKTDHVTVSLYTLLMRVLNTHISIHYLHGYTSTDTFVVDAAVLLRCLFDAYFQANYIYKDPIKRLERAELYVEFEHVERYVTANKFLKHNNEFAKMLHASPYKDEGQKECLRQYNRVKHLFLKKGKNEPRDKWYSMSMADLAGEAELKDEYDTFVGPFSGCAHSSYMNIRYGAMLQPDAVILHSGKLLARMLLLNINHNGLAVTQDELKVLNLMVGSLLNAM
jgi:hypothetical protein